MDLLPFSLFLAAGLASSCAAASTPSSTAAHTSFSRTFTSLSTYPTFFPEVFEVIVSPLDQSKLSPGYIFIDPYYGNGQWGPQIYTPDGDHVWHGPTFMRTQNLHVCDFLGQQGVHICYSQRRGQRPLPAEIYPDENERPNSTYPWNLVLNQSYVRQTKPFEDAHDALPFNVHAYESAPGGDSFVSLVAKPEIVDLRHYGGAKRGWIANQCIEEVDFRTRESLFHWCYHQSGLPIWATTVFFRPRFLPSGRIDRSFKSPNHTTISAGFGDLEFPWDYIHMNAVTKNKRGNYYISVRHTDQILCIAGPKSDEPGKILWILGGKMNDFELNGWPSEATAPFSKQHDVRPVPADCPNFSSPDDDDNDEVISIFNNAYKGLGIPASQTYSDAQVIRVNARTKQAHLLASFPHPRGEITKGRGSTQVLPNGNVFVSWGELGDVSEFDGADGTLLYHANFRQPGWNDSVDAMMSYRAYKNPWVGKPLTDPLVVVSGVGCSTTSLRRFASPILVAYVSWNGATEVRGWRLAVGPGPEGPWTPAATVAKEGFETVAQLSVAAVGNATASAVSVHHLRVRVEAVDGEGVVIGSAVVAVDLEPDWDCRERSLVGIWGVLALVAYIEVAALLLAKLAVVGLGAAQSSSSTASSSTQGRKKSAAAAAARRRDEEEAFLAMKRAA